MSRLTAPPTGIERRLGEEEIIVSKTDRSGRIQYINKTFLKISDFTEKEIIGQPHSVVRHPNMPRSIFKKLWDTIESGQEIFAFVCNLAKNGDHYWVYAHVTPTFGHDGSIVGYHSNRRAPDRAALSVISELYDQLLLEEKRHSDSRMGLRMASQMLDSVVTDKCSGYDEFICGI
jgi:PAS domain S-box-containing protein